MKVRIISREIVHSTIAEDLHEFEFSPLDHFALGHFPLAMVYGFKSLIDPQRIRSGLSTLLNSNPEMGVSIRIKEDGSHVMASGSGIELVVQECDEPIPDCNGISQLPMEQYPITCPTITPSDLLERRLPLFGLRITHFGDGSSTLGVRLTHSHLDGSSILRFLVSLGKIYNGEGFEPPTLGRSRISALGSGYGHYPSQSLPITAVRATDISTAHKAPPNNCYACRQIIFPKGQLESYVFRIKGKSAHLSSSDILCSTMWKAWSLSSVEPGNEQSALYRLFDLRTIKELDLPESYQGNAAIDRCIELSFDEIRDSSVEKLALLYQRQIKPLKLQEIKEDIAYLSRLHRQREYAADGNFTRFIRKFSFDILRGRGLFVNDMRFLKLDQLKFSSELIWYAAGQDYSLPGYIEISRIFDGTIFVRHHSLVEHSEPFERMLREIIRS